MDQGTQLTSVARTKTLKGESVVDQHGWKRHCSDNAFIEKLC
jgi:hypothetical protein